MQAVMTTGLDIAKSVFQDPRVRPPDHGLAPIHETSKRLDAVPGLGPALASALVASVADPKAFRSADIEWSTD
jgi:hypothetical protein